MLCMKCKKNEAAFYYKQNINGKVSETALCEQCAGELGYDMMAASLSFNPFAGLFGLSAPALAAQRRAEPVKRCPLCGSEFADLVRCGKIGCAKCYEVFAAELEPTFGRLHGKLTHTGRAPKGHKIKTERVSRENKLREELKQAIEEQNFEHAAALRDKLKAFEAENKKNESAGL